MLHMTFRFASFTVDSNLVASKSNCCHLQRQSLNSLKRIKTNIAYVPASEPQPASQMRREAYETGALVPCPMDDPEGWFALPTVTTYRVVKSIDNLLHTKVDFTVSVL